jgi:putative spermidine/putrescine transport system ATP-binding protein
MGAGIEGTSLRLLDLTKQFGTVVAVDRVCLEVKSGEFLSLLGPSGSGKTTTLMMIAGFESPSEGEIFLGARPISRVATHRRGIGVVFQNYALFPHLSVYENVAFPLKMRHVAPREIARHVAEALQLVRLPGYESRFPRQLSGGQQQRVALARALVFHPGIVLMDEPLGALDKQLREEMQLEIKQLQRALGMTVVYVTHDQSEALTMSDRIAVMNHGRVEQLDTPEGTYERPRNRFVASFIGESNFLEGSVVDVDDGGTGLVAIGGHLMHASGLSPGSVGRTVMIVVRPEKIIAGTQPVSSARTTRGVVQDTIYIGDRVKYRVQLAMSPAVTVVVAQSLHGGSLRLSPGDATYLTWDMKDARALPGESVAPAMTVPSTLLPSIASQPATRC